MNISLPALVFANIVPAFTPQNIASIGPLFLIAFVYMIIGFSAGVLIREVFYVPRNFWQGIVVLTGMSNWGNLRPSTLFCRPFIPLIYLQRMPSSSLSHSKRHLTRTQILNVRMPYWSRGVDTYHSTS